MSDIFQEVDEELKRQHMDKALRTYGPIVGVVALVVLASFSGYFFWQGQAERRAEAAGDNLVRGMEFLAMGQQDLAASVFAGIAENAPGQYEMLARFNEAAALRQAGNTASAIEAYDEIAGDAANAQEFRDLARYYAGLTTLGNDASTFVDIETRLAPVADGEGPWRFHATESLAYAAFRENQFDVAATRYRQLTDNPETPAGVAARATEMLNLTEAASD